MTFSTGFSEHFNKQEMPPQFPDGSIGNLSYRFYKKFGYKSIATTLQEFNEIMGDWKLSDFT